MQEIHLSFPFTEKLNRPEGIVLVLGFFDGVHRGHQEVIKRGKEEAQRLKLPLAVMTFNQDPKVVFNQLPADEMTYLSPLPRKLELFEALGVDITYIVDFTEAFSRLKPQDFIEQYIIGLAAQSVVVGFDYTYGPPSQANVETLTLAGEGRFDVVVIEQKSVEGHKIGSRYIVSDIQEGQLEQANAQLGYTYLTEGTVIHGAKRGRTLGYPTANIQVVKHTLLPQVGVYVVSAYVKGKWYRGMASVGYNVTFEDRRDVSLEVYLLDFSEEIYGSFVRVRWHHYLRPEIKFSQVSELILQLDQDKRDTENYFASCPLNNRMEDFYA